MDNIKMDTSFEKRQEMVKVVDESAVTLMSSLDSVHATTGVLLQQLEAYTETSGQTSSETQRLQECKRTAKHLIMVLEGSVLHQKAAAVESLSRLLHVNMTDRDESSNNIALSSRNLLLDNYKDSRLPKLADEEHHLKTLLNENDHLRKTVHELENYIMVLREKEQSFLKEKKSLNKQIQSKEGRWISMENEIEEMRKHVTLLENKTTEQNETIGEKEKENNRLVKQLQELNFNQRKEIETLEKDIINNQGEKKSLLNQIEKLQQTTDKLQADLEKSKRETTTKEEAEEISKVLATVEKELILMKSKRILQVQLYRQNRSSLTINVEHELTKLLKGKMESEKLELEFLQCAKPSDIQGDTPLLLLCFAVSSLETDVASTIQGLSMTGKAAALIFHYKDAHALPTLASERVLTGQVVRSLGGIYDMAFLSGRGIYACEMNDDNIVSLINFINREGVKKTINV